MKGVTARTTLKFGLIGDPIEHSKSPEIHAGFFTDSGLHGKYEAVKVRRGQANEALGRLAFLGFHGLNITTPLKEEILECVSMSDDMVTAVGAANTIVRDDSNKWRATNTDGYGARIAMELALGGPLEGKTIVVLGTGATGRAAIYEFIKAGAQVRVWSRGLDRSLARAERLGATPWSPDPKPAAIFAALPPQPWLPTEIKQLMLDTEIVVDANYGDRSTLATNLERSIIDGSTMLEAQARASFDFWCERLGVTRRGGDLNSRDL